MTYKEYIVFNYEEFDELLAIDTEEINQDDEKSEVAVFTRDTLIKDVRHTLVPIEYPATSDEGIAHMYHVENWTDSKAAFRDQSGGFSSIGFHNFHKFSLSDIVVKKAIKHCGGIKACQLADPDILVALHSDIDLETDPFICKNNLKVLT
ncbi:hypothetical protein RhiirA4_474011 [Rhizophagus irregularis]|uniref:Uncharacterized protein n=1 Tax=Rhizophagus irregularis TaxID=588596 RepID=A0A2I1H7S0_9GLOM|nr:hypothetical protein RhiirA4_474011 [Rhizophagus irregularis]